MTDLSDWIKRKPFICNNSGSTITEYPTLFTIHRTTGTDSSYTVYLSTGCEENYDDIRFVKSDEETLLDYWIESATSETATVWVEFDSLANGDNSFYIYYGNAAATAVSNGKTTFPLFDDFSDATYDSTLWAAKTGAVTQTDSTVTISYSGANGMLRSDGTTFGTNYAVRCRADLDAPNKYSGGGFQSSNAADGYIRFYGNYMTGGVYNAHNFKDPNNTNTSLGSGYTGEYVWEIQRNGSTSIRYLIDDTIVATHTTNITTTSLPVIIQCETNPSTITADWILVRKIVATPPTISSWGSEESAGLTRFISKFNVDPIIQLNFIYNFDENQGDISFIDKFSISPITSSDFIYKFDTLMGLEFISMFDSGRTELDFISMYDNLHGNAAYILINVFSTATTNSWYSNNGGNY